MSDDENDRALSYDLALLLFNRSLRKSPRDRSDDLYVRTILAARLHIAQAEGQELKMIEFAREVAPEIVAETTALRHIRAMADDNLLLIHHTDRGQIVTPTRQFLERRITHVNRLLALLEKVGFSFDRANRSVRALRDGG